MGLYKKTNRTNGGRPVWEKVGGRTRFMVWRSVEWCLTNTEGSKGCYIISKFDLLPRIPRSGWRYAYGAYGEREPDPTLTVAGKWLSTSIYILLLLLTFNTLNALCPIPLPSLLYNISFLVPGDGTATKCYLCTKLIGGSAEDDSCGSFDSKTPTCNLNEGGICWKQYEKR